MGNNIIIYNLINKNIYITEIKVLVINGHIKINKKLGKLYSFILMDTKFII
jgi:hypothetical protein